LKRLVALLGMAMPAVAQYAGPAILSRGEAPSAMAGPQVSFRPFVEVTGVYSTGLSSSVAVNSEGDIAHERGAGVSFSGGVSGSHNWRHTLVGLTLRASYNDYPTDTDFNSSSASLLLGVRHQLSRHISLNWNNSFGVFTSSYGLLSTLSPAVPFDPSQTYTPTTDFFNNRTVYGDSMLGLSIQRSTRLSFNFNGGVFINRLASSALYGTTGENASADIQYRVSRRMTVGGNYLYTRYSFSHTISDTNLHGASFTVADQLSRWWEFSGYAGFMRVESKFIQTVPVDPAVAAIIGITQSSEVVYSARYVPNFEGRLSRTFHKGVFYVSAGHTVTPGNGLFLTSTSTHASTGYTYTGLRKWSFGANVTYMSARSIGNVIGDYGGANASVTASRQISRSLHWVASFNAERYNSSDFAKYNQMIYGASMGFGWSPGDVPLRIW
jgi:hypothetical protein